MCTIIRINFPTYEITNDPKTVLKRSLSVHLARFFIFYERKDRISHYRYVL